MFPISWWHRDAFRVFFPTRTPFDIFRSTLPRQNRIQRCIMDCADEAKDLIPPGAKEGDAVVQRAMAQVSRSQMRGSRNHWELPS